MMSEVIRAFQELRIALDTHHPNYHFASLFTGHEPNSESIRQKKFSLRFPLSTAAPLAASCKREDFHFWISTLSMVSDHDPQWVPLEAVNQDPRRADCSPGTEVLKNDSRITAQLEP